MSKITIELDICVESDEELASLLLAHAADQRVAARLLTKASRANGHPIVALTGTDVDLVEWLLANYVNDTDEAMEIMAEAGATVTL